VLPGQPAPLPACLPAGPGVLPGQTPLVPACLVPQVCSQATLPGNKNRRRNTSLLVRDAAPGDDRRRNILIDAGK